MGILWSFENTASISGVVTSIEPARTESYQIWADPRARCWESQSLISGERTVSNPRDGTMFVAANGQREFRSLQSTWIPDVLRFCFPSHLQIWGRQKDGWRMERIVEGSDPSILRVQLRSRIDPLTAILSIDRKLGLATKFETHFRSLSLRDVEESGYRPEFWWGQDEPSVQSLDLLHAQAS